MIKQPITSTANPLVKDLATVSQKRSRNKHNAFLMEGQNLLEAALRDGSRGTVQKILFLEENLAYIESLLPQGHTVELIPASEKVLAKLSDAKSPYGIIALASYSPAPLESLASKRGPTMVLDGIQDPGNVGTIIRTAHALGASAVVMLPGTADPFSPKTLRASAGSVFRIPIAMAERDELIEHLKKTRKKIVATVGTAKTPIYKGDLGVSCAFVLGNEGAGVSQKMLDAADSMLSIPLSGGAESLNVTAAAAICLYEYMTQRLDN